MDAVRTCLGCRRRERRNALLRVVARGGDLVADPSATLPGRGAWVHPTPACVDAAIQRKAFGRALRVAAPLDPRMLSDTIGAQSGLPEEQAERQMDN